MPQTATDWVGRDTCSMCGKHVLQTATDNSRREHVQHMLHARASDGKRLVGMHVQHVLVMATDPT